jgi:hypothetical protein
VTALSKAFAIAIPHEQAMDVKEEVAFFQAVKARLVKFDSTGLGRSDEEIETTIRQVIDQALVSEQVIDVLIAFSSISINDLLLTRFFLEPDFNSSLSSFFNTSKAIFLCSMPLSSSKNSSDRMGKRNQEIS